MQGDIYTFAVSLFIVALLLWWARDLAKGESDSERKPSFVSQRPLPGVDRVKEALRLRAAHAPSKQYMASLASRARRQGQPKLRAAEEMDLFAVD
jgi:hypothetical protein